MNGQVNYLRHYMIHLRQLVGYKKAEELIRKSGVIVSTGTNDYLQNYFLEPTRPKQFTLDKYQDFLVFQMCRAIQVINTSIPSYLFITIAFYANPKTLIQIILF